MACQTTSEEKITDDKTDEDGIKTGVADGMIEDKSVDTSLTMSTKLSSTDQLICKTPRDSPSQSVRSVKNFEKIKIEEATSDDDYLLYLGALQILFGFLMSLCGIMVILHDASLSQFGGGIWGGCLAMATGITGVMAAAKEWCPLKSTPQKIAHTSFLALSLISLAVSQLIVALAATGLGRDLNKSEYDDFEEQVTTTTTPASPGKISITLPLNYLSLLSNTGLLIVSAVECILAAVASYKCSRTLCPCFRKDEGKLNYEIQNGYRHALVSSWLGKHSSTPLYFVAAPPSSAGPGSKLSGSLPLTPVFTIPQQMVHPPIVRYPLIPAPLGTIPSPIIPPPSRKELLRRQKKYISKYHRHPPRDHRARRSRSRSKDKSVTEEDVARTYTGLDKTIAENFIDICDLKNASSSLCSDSNCSCTSSCRRSCNGGCSNSNSGSDVNSREYLVNKM